jgi:hypothetical protein
LRRFGIAAGPARLRNSNDKTNPMTPESLGDTPVDRVPACPHCGEPLYPFGALIEKWGLLHWVEAWHCPIHGHIDHQRLDAVLPNTPKLN